MMTKVFPFRTLGAAVLAAAMAITAPTQAANPDPAKRLSDQALGQQQASLIFQILASELAIAQGEIGIAAATYLSIARETKDPAAAKRATELAIAARSPSHAEQAAALWLAATPNDPEAQGTLDLLQLATGEGEKLVRSLLVRRQKALEAHELDAFVDYVAGLAGRSPNKPLGVSVFERVTAKDREKSSVRYTLAMLYERVGRFDDMERLLRELIAKDPAHAHARNALGYHFADRNQQLPEALRLIEQALRLAPNDAHIIDSMGWIQFRLGNLAEAEKYLRQAYRQQPDAEISTHLGEVLWVAGKTEEAESFLRAAFRADPRNEVLLDTLKRLGIPPLRVHPQ
jgi:tetratricopeptide (TPR) repeat protein